MPGGACHSGTGIIHIDEPEAPRRHIDSAATARSTSDGATRSRVRLPGPAVTLAALNQGAIILIGITVVLGVLRLLVSVASN